MSDTPPAHPAKGPPPAAAPEEPAATTPGELSLDILSADAPVGDRIPLTDTSPPPPPPVSSMELLTDEPASGRIDFDEPPEPPEPPAHLAAGRSPLEALTRRQDPGARIRLSPESAAPPPSTPAPPEEPLVSSADSLIDALGWRSNNPPAEEPPAGDISTSDDRASRMSLRGTGPDPAALARLEAVMSFSARRMMRRSGLNERHDGVVELSDEDEEPGALLERSVPSRDSSMGSIFSSEPGGRISIEERAHVRQTMPNDLSRWLNEPAAPRLELPRRSRPSQPTPDGVTPIPPELQVVIGEPDPRQRCPEHRAPLVESGERSHERLDFRYNRFLRLEVRRPELTCAKCPGERYTSRLPAFLCQQAPLGNGLLALAAIALYFDRLPLDKLRLLLEQLGAPLGTATLLDELDRASDRLAPIVDEMRSGADHAEAPLPALVTGTLRDTPGSVEVHTGGGHIVFDFVEGEARKSDAKRVRGPQALQRWRGQGLAGRWGQLRGRFLLALLTDPERARAGLYAIEQLPPDPPTDPAALSGLRAWLDGARAAITSPKNRYEHAVTAMEAMWPLLTRPDPAARAQVSDTWIFEQSDGDAHAALRWLSIVESCAALELPLWDYLYGLLRAVATDPELVAAEWTPGAVKGRS